MTRDELYQFISPLKKRTWKMPDEYSEEYHQKLYIAACKLGIIREHPLHEQEYNDVSRFIREIEFHDKDMWEQGNRQALTYRSNRIDENIRHYLWKTQTGGKANYCWVVYNRNRWSEMGYVAGKSQVEAEQLAKMMYGAMAEDIHVNNAPKFPLFSSDQESFTRIMNEKMKSIKKAIKRKEDEIREIQESIDECKVNIEFLMLNMTAFQPNIKTEFSNENNN